MDQNHKENLFYALAMFGFAVLLALIGIFSGPWSSNADPGLDAKGFLGWLTGMACLVCLALGVAALSNHRNAD